MSEIRLNFVIIVVSLILATGAITLSSGITSHAQDFDIQSLLSSIKEINGTYNNDALGFQINLPKDWSGSEMSTPVGKIATVSPNEMNLNFNETAAMTIRFINGAALATIANQSGLVDDERLFGTNESSRGPECKLRSTSIENINGISSEQMTFTCANLAFSNANMKVKGYTFAKAGDSLIAISLAGTEDAYTKELPKFEESVRTIKLPDAADISNSAAYKEYKKILNKFNK